MLLLVADDSSQYGCTACTCSCETVRYFLVLCKRQFQDVRALARFGINYNDFRKELRIVVFSGADEDLLTCPNAEHTRSR